MNSDDVSRKQPRLLESYLEAEDYAGQRLTLKMVGDNLRNYPLGLVLWAAVVFLWSQPSFVANCAAVLWGVWLGLFTYLTVWQTCLQVAAALTDLSQRVLGVERWSVDSWWQISIVMLSACIALVMAFTSVMVGTALYRAIPH